VGGVLGKIGLSGRTQFPHVHVSMRHNGIRIDLFAPSGRLTCHSSVDTLWDTAIEYDAGGLLSLRFFDHSPKIETLRFGIGVQKGDIVTLRIDGPRSTSSEHSVTMDRNQAHFMRLGGKKLSRRVWRSGEYHATATMTRDSQIISELKSAITVP
jgi:hypothetical protein